MPTSTEIAVGVCTGLIQTFLFNPIDRALYLHIKDNTSFLAKSNWTNMYHGVFNALGNRVIQYGFYYNIVDWYLVVLDECCSSVGSNMVHVGAGIATGVTTAILLNPVSCVKYHAWGTDLSLWVVAKSMYSEAGMKSFTRGLGTTASRDSVFSACYLLGKKYTDSHIKDNKIKFFANSAISCVATVLTSPINYIRNIKYATGYQNSNPSVKKVLRKLLQDQCAYNGPKDLIPVFRYYTHKLAIGWGTLRVGVGIASGQYIFDTLMIQFGAK